MLAWLRRLFQRRDDRELFAYWDGQKQRRIDPLVAWRKLWADEEIDLGRDFKTALDPRKADGTAFYPDSEVAAAEERLLALTRKVFGVAEWTEAKPGLTVGETIGLLGEYLRYRNELKKKLSSLPTPLPSSDTTAEPDSSDSDPTECPPSSEPDSPCTESGSSDAEPSGRLKPSEVL